MSYDGYTLHQGDVLLLEGFKEMIGSDRWISEFGVVRKVPNSAPPRKGRWADNMRAVITGIGLIAVVGGASMNKYVTWIPDMQVLAFIFLCFLLSIKGLTVEEAYDEIKAPVLFTIAGAFALGDAMKYTRLARCLASGVTAIVPPGGLGIRAGMYLATICLGQFLNSAANVAIVGQIGIAIAKQTTDVEVGELAMVITYAASAVYMAPYGYQTNTMVMKPGNYEWGDFIKFGGLLQICHFFLVVFLSPIFYQLSPQG